MRSRLFRAGRPADILTVRTWQVRAAGEWGRGELTAKIVGLPGDRLFYANTTFLHEGDRLTFKMDVEQPDPESAMGYVRRRVGKTLQAVGLDHRDLRILDASPTGPLLEFSQ